MRSHTVLLGVLIGCATAATAEPVFLAFTNNTMHRFTLNVQIESIQMSDSMMSLARRGDGALVGHSPRGTGEQMWQSYELLDPLGAPSLSLLSDQIGGPRGTLSFVGSQGFAIGNVDELMTVDSNTLEQTGTVGNMGLPINSNGSGYDAVNDVLYIINGTDDALYRVDYNNATPTLVGQLGNNYLFGGAEYYDGTLYALLQDTGLEQFVLGSVDTTTGQFTALQVVAAYDPNENTFASLAVIPSPSVIAVLGMGGLLASRRRR